MENRVKADLHNHLGRYGIFDSFNETIDFAADRLGENGIFAIANCNDFRYERFINSRGYDLKNLTQYEGWFRGGICINKTTKEEIGNIYDLMELGSGERSDVHTG